MSMQIIGEPIEFHPILKRIRWGGRRLGTVLQKPIGSETDYAESWEIADHCDGESVVCRGTLEGTSLKGLVEQHSQGLFGSDATVRPKQFPLLIKFLDAHDRLSVQVHPNDAQAKKYAANENGKTEAWVIIDASQGSRIYAGLKPEIDRAALLEAVENGSVESCLHSYAVQPGDCIFIPAGTVHAIGEGILLAEVQQQSNLTFRLYDWGRVDADGNPRELHVEKALDCIDFARGPVDPVVPEPCTAAGHDKERLIQSPFFTLQRHRADRTLEFPECGHFRVLMMLQGRGMLSWNSESRRIQQGQSVLLPADCPDVAIVPEEPITLLEAFAAP